MDIILIIFLILLVAEVLLIAVWLIKWVLRSKTRSRVFSGLIIIGLAGSSIHHLFFKNMHFIQSKIYPDLYLVKYPDMDQTILHQAIEEKISQHINNQFPAGKKLAYQRENSIFFYKYYKVFPISIFQDAGTAYFLENEEDLGGFVTEEIGMYSKYKLAEFTYTPCKTNKSLSCGEVSYFDDGVLVKSDNIFNLVNSKKITREVDGNIAKDKF